MNNPFDESIEKQIEFTGKTNNLTKNDEFEDKIKKLKKIIEVVNEWLKEEEEKERRKIK